MVCECVCVCGYVRSCACDVGGPLTLPPCGLIVGAGAGLAVVGATSARVTKVAGATLVTLRALCVVLAALLGGKGGEHAGHSLTWTPLEAVENEQLDIFGEKRKNANSLSRHKLLRDLERLIRCGRQAFPSVRGHYQTVSADGIAGAGVSIAVAAGAGAEIGAAGDALEARGAHLAGQAGIPGRTPGRRQIEQSVPIRTEAERVSTPRLGEDTRQRPLGRFEPGALRCFGAKHFCNIFLAKLSKAFVFYVNVPGSRCAQSGHVPTGRCRLVSWNLFSSELWSYLHSSTSLAIPRMLNSTLVVSMTMSLSATLTMWLS